jgi:hypothetical protein
VVSVHTLDGTAVGSGFWVSPRAVATSWHSVAPQAGGLQVIVFQASGPPLALDAVLVFAIPVLDVAFLVVNPLTVGGMLLEPTVLPVATVSAATGETVFALSNGLGVDGNSMTTGVVREASLSRAGYITDIATTLPLFLGSSGAAVIRVPDLVVVGMAQYALTATGPVPLSPGPDPLTTGCTYSAGVSSRLLAAAIYWAFQECKAMSAPYLLGASTKVTLSRSLALGQRLPVEADGVLATAVLPMPTAGIVPAQTELGIPCVGATVGVPRLTETPDLFNPGESAAFTLSFSGTQTVTPASTAPASTLVLDTGYVRVHLPAVFQDISVDGINLSDSGSGLGARVGDGYHDTINPVTGSININQFINPAPVVEGLDDVALDPYTNVFRTSVLPSADPLVAADAPYTSKIVVSALGMVGFDVDLDADLVLAAIQEPAQAPFLFVAPFASTAFANTTYAGSTAGTPGGPLAVFLKTVPGAVIVQWQGYAAETLAPVCFQVYLGLDTVANVTLSYPAGQVTYAYRADVLPGPWAGGRWLTGTSLQELDEASRRPIVVGTPPSGGEALYFGVASYTGTNMCSVLASDLHTYMLGPHGEGQPGAPLPAPTVSSTVVTANAAAAVAPFFTYAVFLAAAPSDLLTVVAVNALPVGAADLDNASLSDVLVQTGLQGVPSVSVQLLGKAFTASQALPPAGMSSFFGSAQYLGLSPVLSSTGPVSQSAFQFTPVNELTATPAPPESFFSGAVLSAPYSYTGSSSSEPQQGQLVSVQGTVVLSTAAVLEYVQDSGRSAMFTVSLLHTQGTRATDFWVASPPPSATVGTTTAFFIIPDTPTTFTVITRVSFGYGGPEVSLTSAAVTSSTTLTLPFALECEPAIYLAKVNALALGRPPLDSFSQVHDINGPSILVPGTVVFSAVNTSYRAAVAVTDSTRQYAVTRTPRDLARPLFENLW